MANTIELLGDDAVMDSIITRTITKIEDDSVETIGEYAFYGCSALFSADFPSAARITAHSFGNCSSLSILVLINDSMCILESVDALEGTAIAKGEGFVYVPRALLTTYKADDAWQKYASQIVAKEDYTIDGTLIGELATAIFGIGTLDNMTLA